MKLILSQRYGYIAFTHYSTPGITYGDCSSCGSDCLPVVLLGVLYPFPAVFNPLQNPVCMNCLAKLRFYRPGFDEIEHSVSRRKIHRIHQIYNTLALFVPSDVCKMVLGYVTDDIDIFENHLNAYEKNVTIVRHVKEVLPYSIAMLVARMTA
jgi:hypothetical protein